MHVHRVQLGKAAVIGVERLKSEYERDIHNKRRQTDDDTKGNILPHGLFQIMNDQCRYLIQSYHPISVMNFSKRSILSALSGSYLPRSQSPKIAPSFM